MRPAWWKLVLAFTLIGAMLYGLNVFPRARTGQWLVANGEPDTATAAHGDHAHEHHTATSIDVAAMEAALASPVALAAGRVSFEKMCTPCHEVDGGGVTGPNLTDDYWMHGNTHGVILAVVSNGVLEKGMPGWRAVLTPEQLAQVSAFTATLHGTKPAVAKAPQGEKLGAPVAGGEAAGDSAK